MAAAAPPSGNGLQAKKVFNMMNDKLAAGAARLNGGEYQDVDIAIVKATNHDEVAPKEKHVRTLKEAVSSAPNRRKVIYIVHELYDRLKSSGEDWLVVIKTLMVYHRIMKADDQCNFKMEMGKYMDKRKLNTFLRLDNFSDHTKKETWDYSAWVRAYSLYLDTRLEIYRNASFDLERDVGAGETKLKTTGSQELLDVLPRLQQLMQRVLGCVPEGAATTNAVIMEALKWVLSECFRLYRAVSEGVINLADRFFEMDRVEARKALDIYREAIDSTDRMQEFFAKIQNMSAGKSLQFPRLAPPPEDFLEQMEAYAKGAPGPGNTPGTVVTRLGTLMTRREDASTTPLTVSTVANGVSAANGVNGDAQSDPANEDLLGFGDLDVDDKPAQQATTTPAAVASPDPFGDSAFNASAVPTPPPTPPRISVRGLPPSIPSPSPASNGPRTPSLIDDWAGANIQSASPAAAPRAPSDLWASLASPTPAPTSGAFPSPSLRHSFDQARVTPPQASGTFPSAPQRVSFDQAPFTPPQASRLPGMATPSSPSGGFGFGPAPFPTGQTLPQVGSPHSPSGAGNPFATAAGPSGPQAPARPAMPAVPMAQTRVAPAAPAVQARAAPSPAYQHGVRDPFGDMMSDIIPTKPASHAPGVPMSEKRMPAMATTTARGGMSPMGQPLPIGGSHFGMQPTGAVPAGNPFGENAFPSAGNWT